MDETISTKFGIRISTKDGGSVLCEHSDGGCSGCFFNDVTEGCSREKYFAYEEHEKGCSYRKFTDYKPGRISSGPGIVAAMEFKKEYPFSPSEALKDTEQLVDRDPVTLKDGSTVVFAKEHSPNSCEGCCFKRDSCNYSSVGIGNHGGLIVLRRGSSIPLRRMTLDIGIDKAKSTTDMSLKKEKKFSI
jgi:hypothetical protein